jgi:hypothetical protein
MLLLPLLVLLSPPPLLLSPPLLLLLPPPLLLLLLLLLPWLWSITLITLIRCSPAFQKDQSCQTFQTRLRLRSRGRRIDKQIYVYIYNI